MASKRLLGALRSSIRKDQEGARTKALGHEAGLGTQYIYRKARNWGSNAQENTRSFLFHYGGDDKRMKRAQKCFIRGLKKGKNQSAAFSDCGLTYSKGGDNMLSGRNKSSSRHKRFGIADNTGRFSDNPDRQGGYVNRRSGFSDINDPNVEY
jgi:hypothetical protein